jgi:hypothetical protein
MIGEAIYISLYEIINPKGSLIGLIKYFYFYSISNSKQTIAEGNRFASLEDVVRDSPAVQIYMTCYSTCNFVQTFSLSHLNRVSSCEVDHNLAGHTTRHTPILVIVAVQKLQNQLKRIN